MPIQISKNLLYLRLFKTKHLHNRVNTIYERQKKTVLNPRGICDTKACVQSIKLKLRSDFFF